MINNKTEGLPVSAHSMAHLAENKKKHLVTKKSRKDFVETVKFTAFFTIVMGSMSWAFITNYGFKNCALGTLVGIVLVSAIAAIYWVFNALKKGINTLFKNWIEKGED